MGKEKATLTIGGKNFDMDNKEQMDAAGEKLADIITNNEPGAIIDIGGTRKLEVISRVQTEVGDVIMDVLPAVIQRAFKSGAKAGMSVKITLGPAKDPDTWIMEIKNSMQAKGNSRVMLGQIENGQLRLL